MTSAFVAGAVPGGSLSGHKRRTATTLTSARISRHLLAWLFLIGSADAFARGGPVGALGGILEGMLVLAIVGGLVAGAVCGRIFRRTSWVAMAVLALVPAAIALFLPFAGIFLGIPAVVFAAVFATVSDMARSGRLQAHAAGPPPDGDSQRPGPRVGVIRGALRWIAGTYVFWTAASLANFELLGFLAVPPLVLVFPKTIEKFLPFILPPLAVAVAIAVVVTAFHHFVRKKSGTGLYAGPFIFNGCVLVAFLASAEVYRHQLMSQSLLGHVPGHLQSASFLGSVLSYRTYFRGPHASFDEDGKTYYWSYAERKFVQHRDRTSGTDYGGRP